MTEPERVETVLVDPVGQLFINGKPFPYYINQGGVSFEPAMDRGGIGVLNIAVIVEGSIICMAPRWAK